MANRNCPGGRCNEFHGAVQSYNENHSQYTPGSMSDRASGEVLMDRNKAAKKSGSLTKPPKNTYGNA